ncbi:MAG: OsmC family protein [Mangrovibacterium sp.]
MKHIIDLAWKTGMTFETDLDGHKLVLDVNRESGGNDNGSRPKKLMLVALAGCTAMDVISILKKMHVYPTGFNVFVEGELAEEHPKKYTQMKVVYQFKGENLAMDKLQKAVNLSEEKYCGVIATLKNTVDLTTEIRIVE